MTCAARAYGTVGRVVGVATDVAHFGVEETFISKILAKEVLDAPEATSCDGAFLHVFGEGDGGTGGGVQGVGGGGCEGAEESGEK